MQLLGQFMENVRKQDLFRADDRLLLAVSGGVDSVVLCDLCQQAGLSFSIAHVNFQLRGEDSEADERFVAALGERYGVKVHVKRVDTRAYMELHKVSMQIAARDIRYGWFDELLAEGPAYLLTAHHADDNIETVVMNFFRGTGVSGLRGMLSRNGRIIRPLLPFSKERLRSYAEARELTWREDISNASDKYSRNYFRNQVLPMVRKVFPEAEHNLTENIRRFADVETLYLQAVETHKKNLLETKGAEIHIPVLKLKKAEPLGTILFEILRPFNFTAGQLPDLLHLPDAKQGSYVQSSTHRIFKNRRWLVISPNSPTASGHIFIEEGMAEIPFGGGRLMVSSGVTAASLQTSPATAVMDARKIEFPLILRKWKNGDYFYPLGMPKKKKIARFLIDSKLSPTQKEHTWVLESGNRICWVVGLRLDDRFKITPSTEKTLAFALKENII